MQTEGEIELTDQYVAQALCVLARAGCTLEQAAAWMVNFERGL
jgi:hypothetical protein